MIIAWAMIIIAGKTITAGSCASTPAPLHTWVLWPNSPLILGSYDPSPNQHLAPVPPYPYPAPFSPLGLKPGCWEGKEERRENVAILGQRSC